MNGQPGEYFQTEPKKKKSSYLQHLITKSKELTGDMLSVKKVNKKRKKTLTVFTPFELRTSKRVRLDIDEEKPQQE